MPIGLLKELIQSCNKKYLNAYISNCFITHVKSEKRQKRFWSLIQEDAIFYHPFKLEKLSQLPSKAWDGFTSICTKLPPGAQSRTVPLWLAVHDCRHSGQRTGLFSLRLESRRFCSLSSESTRITDWSLHCSECLEWKSCKQGDFFRCLL